MAHHNTLARSRRKREAIHRLSNSFAAPCPELVRFWMLPSRLRRIPLVQRLVGKISAKPDGEFLRIELPTGDIIFCPANSRAMFYDALKIYFEVAYLGQYFQIGQPAPGAVVYDVGGNIGCFALAASRLVGPEGHVYSFEPVPTNVACLERTIAVNGLTNVTVIQAAIGRETGRTVIHLNPGCLAHSGVFARTDQSVEVDLLTVDGYAATLGAKSPDFLKMDVEGMEADALRGAAQTLKQQCPFVAVSGYHREEDTEVLPALIREARPDYQVTWDADAAWAEKDIFAYVPGCTEDARWVRVNCVDARSTRASH